MVPSGNKQFHDEKPEALRKRVRDEYGGGDEDFYKKLHRICLDVLPSQEGNGALDIGCGCGRLTFDLAKDFKEVRFVFDCVIPCSFWHKI